MFALYITHPQVKIDPLVEVPRWGLSDLGAKRAFAAARLPWAQQLQRIISSDETKAIETAEILASSSDTEVEVVEGMHENDRSATGFLPPDAFEAAADWFFAHPDESFKGWERAVDAQQRIVSAVDTVLSTHDPSRPIAFIGHGGVGTLLFCHLTGQPIHRSKDQMPGGGNLYCFALADRHVTCNWTPMDEWQGWR